VKLVLEVLNQGTGIQKALKELDSCFRRNDELPNFRSNSKLSFLLNFLMQLFTDHPPEKFGAVSSSGTSRGRSSMNNPGRNRSSANLLKKDREMNWRKYGQGRRSKGRAKCTISPLKPLYDMDVEIRSPRIYDSLIGEVRI